MSYFIRSKPLKHHIFRDFNHDNILTPETLIRKYGKHFSHTYLKYFLKRHSLHAITNASNNVFTVEVRKDVFRLIQPIKRRKILKLLQKPEV